MSASSKRIGWDGFRSRFVEAGLATRIPMLDDPSMVIVHSGEPFRLAAMVELADRDRVPAPFANVAVRELVEGGRRYAEFAVDEKPLARPFFELAMDICDQLEAGQSALSAIEVAFSTRRELLRRASRLSLAETIGLFGELWFLRELINGGCDPASALDAWTGPRSEAHDFRVASNEFEIKTTTREKPIHTINGLQQLAASPGCTLRLISIQVTDPGVGGLTLGGLIDEVRSRLAHLRPSFDRVLDGLGWSDEPDPQAPRFQLRAAPKVILMDESAPRMTDAQLNLSAGSRSRISGITYDLDVAGLGDELSENCFGRTGLWNPQ